MYAQYAIHGRVFVRFLGLHPVAMADAEHITVVITTTTSAGLAMKEEVWKKRLVGLGSDGAAVMLGSRSGVRVRLAEGHPHVLAVHCMVHRLELSFKDVASKNTCHKRLDSFLLGIYHNSPLNHANLKQSYESLQKQIKSNWRSALGRDAMNDLMTVILVSNDINEPKTISKCG